jgi:hypothetical protein
MNFNFKVCKGAIHYNSDCSEKPEADSQLDMVLREQALLRQQADLDSGKFQIKKFSALMNPDIKPEENKEESSEMPDMSKPHENIKETEKSEEPETGNE